MLKSGSVTPENVAIALEGVVHPGELSASRVCDDRTFMQMVCPADTSKWEGWGSLWGDERGNECRERSRDVWPDKVSVSGRCWVLAQVNVTAGCNWSGLTLQGTITTQCDIDANRYPREMALKRFGALPGKDAQALK